MVYLKFKGNWAYLFPKYSESRALVSVVGGGGQTTEITAVVSQNVTVGKAEK